MESRKLAFKLFVKHLSRPYNERKGFIQKRKQPFSISNERINELYDRYFPIIQSNHQSISFKVKLKDFDEIVYLLRVHFELWIEIKGNIITIFKDFPERFRLIEEVNVKNHWFTPNTFLKGTILYYGLDHYSVCNRTNGIPLSEEPFTKELGRIRPVVQINYEFIEVFRD